MFNQLFVNSLIAGAIYGLAASGFSLIYSTCKFVHFAHGAAIAFSAYFFLFSFCRFGLEFLAVNNLGYCFRFFAWLADE